MTTRTFAAWVEPIAAELRAGRARIVEVARGAPADAWAKPTSYDEGWTCKDLLAHLAAGDWALQSGLRKVIVGEPLRIGDFPDVNETNARNVAERRGRTVEELIAEVEAEGEETQEILAQLGDEHERMTPEDVPTTLGDYLRQFTGHDRAHLADLRAALEGTT